MMESLMEKIRKYNEQLKNYQPKSVKKYRHIILPVLFLGISLFLVTLFSNYSSEAKAKEFFEKYSDKVMLWQNSEDDFIDALGKKFKGKDIEYKIYIISAGDNYWKIANENEINVDTVIGCNPYIKALYACIGDKVVAINKNGVLHYVQGNENIRILSELYNVEPSAIKANNNLSLFGRLHRGDILFIPDAKPCVFTPQMYEAVKRRRIFAVPTNGWVAGRGFGAKMHPVYHVMKFHYGIDMKSGEGNPIFASADGTVTYSGDGGTYGKLIVIKHADGFETRYAHCSRLYVRIGQEVKKKQCIGRVGHTGVVTCAHLHFEIRKNGRAIDPMKYLW